MINGGVKSLDPIQIENFTGFGSGSPKLTDRFQRR